MIKKRLNCHPFDWNPTLKREQWKDINMALTPWELGSGSVEEAGATSQAFPALEGRPECSQAQNWQQGLRGAGTLIWSPR